MRRLVEEVSTSAAELTVTAAPVRWSSALRGGAAVLLALVLWRLAGGGLQGWAVGLGMDDEPGALMAALIVTAISAGLVAAITGTEWAARVGGVLAVIAIEVSPFIVRGSRTHPVADLVARPAVRGWILQPFGTLLLAVVGVSAGVAIGLLVRSDLIALTRLLRRRRHAWPAVVIGLGLGAVALEPALTAVQDGPISALYDYSAAPVTSPHHEPAGPPLGAAAPVRPPDNVAADATGSPEAPAGAAGGVPRSAATPTTGATPLARPYPARIDTLTVGGRTTLVYVPTDYARETSRGFPVVYFLHGYPGNAAQWVGDGAQLPQVLDQLIGDGVLPPLLAVMPDGNGQVLSDSEWGDTPRGDRVETWLVRAVIPAVDARYRTLGARYRGIAGLSAGGFGAVNLSLRHPDLFRWAASYSGYFSARQAVFGAASAANSPAGTAPHVAADQRMPLYVGIGGKDTEFAADTRNFVGELSSLGWTPSVNDSVPGGHGWEAWRLEVVHSLRWLGTIWGVNLLPMQPPPTLAPIATSSPSPAPSPSPTPSGAPADRSTASPRPRSSPTPTPTPSPSPTPTPGD
jgi:enterochelin esterase-like enzyme